MRKVLKLFGVGLGIAIIIKGAVYTGWIFICICMSLRGCPGSQKNMKFLTKDGIHSISRYFLGTFILCAVTHWLN